MAATGYTPLKLYGSTTPSVTPSASNLTNDSIGCEIAINVADKNLFFKDSTNTVNTVPIRQSSASSNGWLSSTDWSTFNSKQPAGSYAVTTGANTFAGVQTFSGSITGPSSVTLNDPSWKFEGGNIYGYVTCGLMSAYYNRGVYQEGGYLFNPTNSGICDLGDSTHKWKNLVLSGNVIVDNGQGIDFSATAGTGTSELLADYEEGTFTPTVFGGTTSGTATYSTQIGLYTKVGRQVTVTAYINWSSGTGTGSMNFGGLPYTTNSNNFGAGSIWGEIGLAASNTLVLRILNSTTNLQPLNTPVGGGVSNTVTYTASGAIMYTATYFV